MISWRAAARLAAAFAAAVVFALAALPLATCSNPVDLVEAVTVEVMKGNDRYLEIVRVSPDNGNDNVNSGTRVKIFFDRSVDLDTIISSNIQILKSGTVDTLWTADYDPLLNIVSLRPTMILEDNKPYVVRVADIFGQDGSSMLDERVWQFSTVTSPAGQVSITSSNSNAMVGYTNTTLVNVTIVNQNSLAEDFSVGTSEASLLDPETNAIGWLWHDCDPSPSVVPFTIPNTEGYKNAYVIMRRLNTITASYEYGAVVDGSILLDKQVPNAGAWRINSDAISTTSTVVSLTPSVSPVDEASGIGKMRFSNNNSTWSAWESYSPTKAWNLETGEGGSAAQGTRWVYTQIMDKAGNSTSSVSDSVIYDTTPPLAPSVSGTSPTLDPTPTWSWSSGGGGGGSFYRYQLNGTTGIWTGPTTSTSYTAGSLADGVHYLYVQQRDASYDYYSPYSVRSIRVSRVLPWDGQKYVDTAPLLEWRSVGLGYSYTVQAYAYNPLTRRWAWIDYASVGTSTSFKVTSALPSGTGFTWRVVAVYGKLSQFIPGESGATFTTN